MSFLSKMGTILSKVAGIAAGVQPIVSAVAPFGGPVASELQLIATVIANTQAIRETLALPGTQALKAATPLVAQEILKSALLAGKKVANQDRFTLGAQKIADGMVDVLDSIHEDAAATISPAEFYTPSLPLLKS